MFINIWLLFDWYEWWSTFCLACYCNSLQFVSENVHGKGVLFLLVRMSRSKHPKKLKYYLQPLIEELQSLWKNGVEALDISKTRQSLIQEALSISKNFIVPCPQPGDACDWFRVKLQSLTADVLRLNLLCKYCSLFVGNEFETVWKKIYET